MYGDLRKLSRGDVENTVRLKEGVKGGGRSSSENGEHVTPSLIHRIGGCRKKDFRRNRVDGEKRREAQREWLRRGDGGVVRDGAI